jgi:hypothetical protein
MAALCVFVFVIHFRPWQGGTTEEWLLALAWGKTGMSGMFSWPDMPGALIGRPLVVVPNYLGMFLTNGGLLWTVRDLGDHRRPPSNWCHVGTSPGCL